MHCLWDWYWNLISWMFWQWIKILYGVRLFIMSIQLRRCFYRLRVRIVTSFKWESRNFNRFFSFIRLKLFSGISLILFFLLKQYSPVSRDVFPSKFNLFFSIILFYRFQTIFALSFDPLHWSSSKVPHPHPRYYYKFS